jgi:hypothetical protein
MRRILSVLLCLALLLGTAVGTASAAADADTRLEVVRVLGILVGDAKGNLNLDNTVTRAEFVKMMVAASKDKDSVTDGSGAVKLENIFRAGSTHVREVAMTEGNCSWKTDADGNRLTICEGLESLADGNHTVTVTLQLSTGEKPEALRAILIP